MVYPRLSSTFVEQNAFHAFLSREPGFSCRLLKGSSERAYSAADMRPSGSHREPVPLTGNSSLLSTASVSTMGLNASSAALEVGTKA